MSITDKSAGISHLIAGAIVGAVAVVATAWTSAQTPPPTFTSPIFLATAIGGLLHPSPYTNLWGGAVHLAYLGGLALLSAILVAKVRPTASGSYALRVGAIAGFMNALANIPGVLAASLTGLFYLVPTALASIVLLSIGSWLMSTLLSGILRQLILEP